MSAASSANASSSSKRPPSNHLTVSRPRLPPVRIAAKSAEASGRNRSGAFLASSSRRVNMRSGKRSTSSANMQKTRRLTKWATRCASCPRARSDCASRANSPAARSVSAWRVCPGLSRSGSVKAHFSVWRAFASRKSSSRMRRTSETVLVQLVWTRMRSVSQTIRSGGFSSATAYCWSWA
jgi:hypothetical protein